MSNTSLHKNSTRMECKFTIFYIYSAILRIRIVPEWNVNWVEFMQLHRHIDKNSTRMECKFGKSGKAI